MQTITVSDTIALVNNSFMTAFRRKDTPAVAKCYSADATILPPQSDAVSGSKSIEGFWTAVIKAGITDVKLETRELVEAGSLAYEIGDYTLFAGGHSADRGKYLVVWRMESGEWKIHRDIWNTSLAA